MSTITHREVAACKLITAVGQSGRVLQSRRPPDNGGGDWHPSLGERRKALRRNSMSVLVDIIAVEFMESARLANPLWVYRFDEITGLTARQ